MEATIEQHGLVLLFAIVAVQAAGIPGPPGKTALVAAAVLAASGHLAIAEVIAVTAVAGTVGGYVGYAWGRLGGRRLLGLAFLRRRLESPLQVAERFFEEHGGKAVFAARFLPGLKVVAAPAAGIARMSWIGFALWHALAAIAFALAFGLGGYYAGRAAIELIDLVGIYVLIPLAAAAALAGVALAFVRRRRRVSRSAARYPLEATPLGSTTSKRAPWGSASR